MNYGSDFDIDLKFGEAGEEKLKQILKDPKIEVKRDRWTYKTGNIAVEYWCRNKPSGISVSKANWWAFIITADNKDDIILLIESNALKKICRKYYNMGRTKEMGDNNLSKSVLIPYKDIIREIYLSDCLLTNKA